MNVGTSLHSWFCSVFFSLSLQWVSYEKDQEAHETFFLFPHSCFWGGFFLFYFGFKPVTVKKSVWQH